MYLGKGKKLPKVTLMKGQGLEPCHSGTHVIAPPLGSASALHTTLREDVYDADASQRMLYVIKRTASHAPGLSLKCEGAISPWGVNDQGGW